jgi:hypothetical protein
MLPASFPRLTATLRTHAITALTALALALPAAPAFALNQRERDVLKGVAGVLLFQEILRSNRANAQTPRPPVYQPPVYQPPVHHPPVQISINRTPVAYAFSSYSASERRAIQRSLARFGYYNGAVDGSFGRGTYNATLSYAQHIGAGASLSTQAGAFGVYDRLLYGTY